MTRISMYLLVGTLTLSAVSCGDDGGGGSAAPSISVPADATFCSLFNGPYQSALDAAVPVTDPDFDTTTAAITGWAEALRDLAPDAIATEAEANVGYHRAQQNKQSASDFIPGSNDMHTWANGNC